VADLDLESDHGPLAPPKLMILMTKKSVFYWPMA